MFAPLQYVESNAHETPRTSSMSGGFHICIIQQSRGQRGDCYLLWFRAIQIPLQRKGGSRVSGRSLLQLFGQIFGGVGQDFGQGRVVVGNSGQVLYGAVEVHHCDQFVDQFTGLGADDVPAEDLA